MSDVTIKNEIVLNKVAFITIDEDTHKNLIKKAYSSVLLDLPKGLGGWTERQGVALDNFKKITDAESYVLLMDNADQKSKKGASFHKALKSALESLGRVVYLPAMTPGEMVSSVVERGGEGLIDLAMSPHGFTTPDEGEEAAQTRDIPTSYVDDRGQLDDIRTGHVFLTTYFTPTVDALTGKTYLVPNTKTPEGYGRRAIALGSKEARENLAGLIYSDLGEIILPRAHDPIETVVSATARLSGSRIETASRAYVAPDGAVWIDLGRQTCECVRLDGSGWEVLPMPSAMETGRTFIKFQALREIAADPVRPDGVPEALAVLNRTMRPLFNVPEDDWHLIVGWMINHLLVNRVSPILMMVGTGGSGKSTMCNVINYAVEGGRAFPRSGAMKKEIDDVMVTISKKRVSVFDNVSRVPGDLSDVLAQAVYGMEYEKRELRTTDDVAILKVDPSLIMNGITTDNLREDLKSRMVTIRIAGTVAVEHQQSDQDIIRSQMENHAETYGALLTLASAVKGYLETAEDVVVDARMKDYGQVLHALDAMLGWSSLARYIRGTMETAEDALEDPLLAAVVYLVRKNGVLQQDGSWRSYIGTSQIATEMSIGQSTLSARLIGEDLELTARQVPDRFSRVQGEWRRLGVVIDMAGRLTGPQRPRIDGQRQSAYPVTITSSASRLIEDAESLLMVQPETL